MAILNGTAARLTCALALSLLAARPLLAEEQMEPDSTDVMGTSRDVSRGPDAFNPVDTVSIELARLELARAEVNAGETGFWQKLIPKVQIGGTIGIREVAFHDPGGALLFPKDSYRLSFSLSISDLLDGSKHDLALIDVRKAELTLQTALANQSQAHQALRKKAVAFLEELTLQREEMKMVISLAAYLEILFRQGKVDYRSVAGARISMVRLGYALRKTEREYLDLKMRLEEGR